MTLADRCTELVVFSHLRWEWVWQRPQHLISRLAPGVRVTFVEEPTAGAVTGRHRRARLVVTERADVEAPGLRTVTLAVPGAPRWVGFGDLAASSYGDRLAELLPAGVRRVAWLYTAMALPLLERIDADLVVYDVMDDLSAFAGAEREQALRHRAAIRRADVIFTGGRSLHAGVTSVRTDGVHCFRSGVEPDHFRPAHAIRTARRRRSPGARPVAGYVGVIDDRIDLHLVEALARELPEWDVQLVGPLAKIDAAALPHAPNVTWMGARPYDELPGVLAGFDVALMPFALNDATRSISPTKTLEYLAAGLPVVSTRVPDVQADVGHVVHLAEDGVGFAAACRTALDERPAESAAVGRILTNRRWDAIAQSMAMIIRSTADRAQRATTTATRPA